MADKLKIGIIGTGTMAQRHIKAYKVNPNAQLWAICDANAARAEAVAKEAGVSNWYSDYRGLYIWKNHIIALRNDRGFYKWSYTV